MPGQQLVQMPDGKLHVLNTSQSVTAATPQQQNAAATTPSSTANTPTGQTVKIAANTLNAVKVSNATPNAKGTPVKLVTNQVQSDATQKTPVQLQQVVQAGQRLKAAIVSPAAVGTSIGTPQKGTIVVTNTGQVVQGTKVNNSY